MFGYRHSIMLGDTYTFIFGNSRVSVNAKGNIKGNETNLMSFKSRHNLIIGLIIVIKYYYNYYYIY